MISDNFKKRFYTSLALLGLVFLIFNYNVLLIYFLIILAVLSILEFLHMANKVFLNKITLFLFNILFVIYIFVFCYLFIFFSNFIGLKIILYIFLLGCMASDIGGFIFGKAFNGPKLTKISPNKTYAGSFGSLIFTLIVMTILFFYLNHKFNYTMIIVAVSTSIFCQIGDLIFSLLKRKAKLKDTGNFLPGHGGILDRIDGILLGVPMGYLTLIILN